MDSDMYVKFGIKELMRSAGADVMAASCLNNIRDITSSNNIKLVIMELYSDSDDLFDCIDFIRELKRKADAPDVIIYTRMPYEYAENILTLCSAECLIFTKISCFKFLKMYICSRLTR